MVHKIVDRIIISCVQPGGSGSQSGRKGSPFLPREAWCGDKCPGRCGNPKVLGRTDEAVTGRCVTSLPVLWVPSRMCFSMISGGCYLRAPFKL